MAAMRGLAKKGDHRTAYSLLDALPAERRSPLLYHGAITACGRSRPIKGRTAMLLWRRMKEENVTVPRATYNALLHAAQGSLTENATSALLAAMDRDGVALNVVSYAVHESNFAAPAPSTRCLLDGVAARVSRSMAWRRGSRTARLGAPDALIDLRTGPTTWLSTRSRSRGGFPKCSVSSKRWNLPPSSRPR